MTCGGKHMASAYWGRASVCASSSCRRGQKLRGRNRVSHQSRNETNTDMIRTSRTCGALILPLGVLAERARDTTLRLSGGALRGHDGRRLKRLRVGQLNRDIGRRHGRLRHALRVLADRDLRVVVRGRGARKMNANWGRALVLGETPTGGVGRGRVRWNAEWRRVGSGRGRRDVEGELVSWGQTEALHLHVNLGESCVL